MGHMLSITEGLQVAKKDMPIVKAKHRIQDQTDNVARNMEEQRSMARYFLHRDMDCGSVFRDRWVERELEIGRLYKVNTGEGEFQFGGRTWKRPVCWVTNSKKIADELENGDGRSIADKVRKGLQEQMVQDGRIRKEGDRYVSYAIEEEHWGDVEDVAWDDVSGKILDKEMVTQARKEEIDEYHKHEVYTKTDLQECWNETGKPPINGPMARHQQGRRPESGIQV